LSRHSMLRARKSRGAAPGKRGRNAAYQRKRRGREAGREAVRRLADRGELSASLLDCAVMLSLVPVTRPAARQSLPSTPRS
jgi:hypothetical protein